MAQSGVKLAVKLLADEKLSIEDRNLLTTTLLAKLGAVPVRARIQLEEDARGNIVRLLVDGAPMDPRRAARIGMSARTAQRNLAIKFVRETIDFMAIKQGVHFNLTPEQGLFAKAILWQHEEEKKLLEALAGGAADEED